MHSRAGTAGRRACAAALGVTAAVLAVGLAACPVSSPIVAKPTEDCHVRYSLEVANEASDRVRVRITISATSFSPPGKYDAGILSLESGEKMMFAMTWGLTGCDALPENGNERIESFAEIRFYDQDSEYPYRIYYYPFARCEDQPDCNRVIHQATDGTWENLFEESPQRPFYLERDGEDPDLARIVITFVPGGGAPSGERRE